MNDEPEFESCWGTEKGAYLIDEKYQDEIDKKILEED